MLTAGMSHVTAAKRLGAIGLCFFLGKGLLWLIAVWFVYQSTD
ncbi:MAG: hypothetical protein PVG24_07985 [Gammaproteobacteria bacterium]|jgi:hypothetical protein